MQRLEFDHLVTARVAFAAHRRELIADWVRSHSVQGNIAHWAKRLREANDAEVAFLAMARGE